MSNLILMDAARRIVRQAWLRCPDCNTFLRDNPECRTCNPYLRGETAAQFRLPRSGRFIRSGITSI